MIAHGRPSTRISFMTSKSARDVQRVSLIGFRVSLLTASLCLGGQSGTFGQGTMRITFDGPPPQPPGTQYGLYEYSESGILFTPVGPPNPDNQFTRNGGGILGYPDDGTPYLQAGVGESLMFSFTDGSLFSLRSVDLAGYSDVVPDFTVAFVGYRTDGSTVSTSFSGTGIGFQPFYFGSEFSDLTRVEIPTFGWSLDNLVVSVPEPSGFAFGALAVLAAGAAGWLRRR
jgi:hypothetical protein